MEGCAVQPGMGGEQRLEQRQRLALTQRMRLALTVLQAPGHELDAIIERELTENPLLEAGPAGATGPAQAADAILWRDVDVAAPPPTLYEHLVEQLDLAGLGEDERRRAEFVAGCLDDAGYLSCRLEDAASAMGVGLPDALAALRRVQELDPAGVGGRDLCECLTLQLSRAAADPATVRLARRLVRDCLDDLAAGRMPAIARRLRAAPAALAEAAALVRSLDPRPGARVGPAPPPGYIVPDAIISRAGGDYAVVINDGGGGRPVLSPYYRRLLLRPDGLAPDELAYLRDKARSALWFLRCLEQRHLTLGRILERVAVHQRRFLEAGVRGLEPLSLRLVAGELGLHESTVGRAVARKHVATPHGTFPLRFFFAAAAPRARPAAGAAAKGAAAGPAIRVMIREILDAEGAGRPLSDAAIAELLRRRGVDVSRRTVAKYRSGMGVESSYRRWR